MAMTRTALTAGALVVLLTVCVGPSGAGLPLPSALKPCPKNDPQLNECATASANAAIAKLKNGIPTFGIPPLDPLFAKRILIEKTAIGVSLDFTDIQMHGLSNSKVKSVKIKHDPLYLRWNIYIPVMQMVGKYEASGRVLVLPIQGKGDFNFTVYGMDCVYEFSCDTVMKPDGELYYKPKTNNYEYSIENVNVFLDNLFNGNKLLGDAMNSFINENWKEVVPSVSPKIADSIVDVMQSIIRALTRKVPAKNFWI